jgi:hypothetical protein
MSKLIRIQTFVVLTFLVLAGGYVEGPNLRLMAEITAHGLSQPALPVDTFTPAAFVEPTVSLSLGRLNFSVPESTVLEDGADASTLATDTMHCFQVEGVTLFVAAPRHNGIASFKDVLEPEYTGRAAAQDSIALMAAAYGADARNASLWMDRLDAGRLRQLLEVRRALPLAVDRVEVLRGNGIKGAVSFTTLGNGRLMILFHYYSEDEVLSETTMLIVDAASDRGVRLARAVIGTFRISKRGA